MPEQAWMLPLIAGLPLLAALLGLLLRRLPPVVNSALGVLSLAGSAALAMLVNSGLNAEKVFAQWSVNWINGVLSPTGTIPAIPLALRVDYAQLLFILTTCLIGIAVLLYAMRERRDDPQAAQFHALLLFFCGSMLLFLVSDTLLLLYTAWELMGLAGYLLIRHKGTPEANRAARQAFWTTRATDFGLLFATFIFMFGFSRYGIHLTRLSDVNIAEVIGQLNANVMQAVNQGAMSEDAAIALLLPEFSHIGSWMGVAGLLVLLAVIGKAAMLPLSFWLPDAMVAPAPVSALLHSATLVAAGPLLLSKLGFGRTVMTVDAYGDLFFNGSPLAWAALIGGITLLVCAAVACCQSQPKKLLAWSTASQLGLCVLGSSALAMEAARFQLLSHAWYKAALFLAVGIIIARYHASSEQHSGNPAEPDFSQLREGSARSPLLFWLAMLPAGLSLAGFIGLAGFYGKEQILAALGGRAAQTLNERLLGDTMPGLDVYWQAGSWLLLLSIPFTAAYTGRLLAGLWPAGPVQQTEDANVDSDRGWGLPTAISILLALVGSIGLAVFWFAYRSHFEGASNNLAWSPDFDIATSLLATLLVVAGAAAGVVSITAGRHLRSMPLLGSIGSFLREGLYIKQIFTGLVGGFGEFLAILAGISDIRLIDWLATRTGVAGRGLANASAWLDLHFVDGIRWWCCEIWWIIKRLHGRFWQNGQIQNYMFILLLGAVILCIVIGFELNNSLGRILGRYN